MSYTFKHVLKNFELFCNPNNLLLTNFYDFISYDCLEESSYIHYIAFTFNSRNFPKPIMLNKEDIPKYLKNNYIVIAFNHCDYVILPVIM